jgi:hypothetical protein
MRAGLKCDAPSCRPTRPRDGTPTLHQQQSGQLLLPTHDTARPIASGPGPHEARCARCLARRRDVRFGSDPDESPYLPQAPPRSWVPFGPILTCLHEPGPRLMRGRDCERRKKWDENTDCPNHRVRMRNWGRGRCSAGIKNHRTKYTRMPGNPADNMLSSTYATRARDADHPKCSAMPPITPAIFRLVEERRIAAIDRFRFLEV